MVGPMAGDFEPDSSTVRYQRIHSLNVVSIEQCGYHRRLTEWFVGRIVEWDESSMAVLE
jgi:hypothetical protein